MENRQQQILSEIKSMMTSIRSQLEMLDTKMAELQQIVDPEDFVAESVDIYIEIEETAEEASAEVVTVQEIPLEETPEADDDLPPADVPAEPEAKVEAVLEEDIPESIFGEPEVVTVAAKAKSVAKPSINDAMADDCAWRKDMPGPAVKDIRSAISLNDRVIFINLLFNEDAQTFVNTLSQINAMQTLDQAVEYITAEFPGWDMRSDLVYRFMMAVRRKVK